MKINHLITAAAASLLLASCNKDDSGNAKLSHFPEDGVMRVTTSVNEAQLTRAGIDNTNITEFPFYLQIITGDGTVDYNYFEKISYNETTGEWEPENQMLWKNSTTQITMTAVGLLLTENNINGSARLSVNQYQSIDEGSLALTDLLYMKATTIANPSTETELLDDEGKLVIKFKHALSKIDINLTLNNQFAKMNVAKTDITDITIGGTIRQYDFTPKTGAVTPRIDETATDLYPYQSAYTAPSAENFNRAEVKYEAIVLPQTVTAGTLMVSFKIQGKPYLWTSTEDITFEQGKRYTFNLQVGDDVVTISKNGFSVTAWDKTNESTSAHTLETD